MTGSNPVGGTIFLRKGPILPLYPTIFPLGEFHLDLTGNLISSMLAEINLDPHDHGLNFNVCWFYGSCLTECYWPDSSERKGPGYPK